MHDARDAALEAVGANDKLIESIGKLRAALGTLDGKKIDIKTSISGIAGPVAGAIVQVNALKAAMADLDSKTVSVRADMHGAGLAAAAGAARFRLWGTGIRLTGNMIHWLIAGFAELAAVVIPAAVAAGAWAAAWMQGAQMVQQHMSAVYTATEATASMFHMTAGQAIGLGNALQKAQDKANPNVYQALGSAVLIVKEHFGGLAQVGVRVGRVFDSFMAKLVFDFSKAGGAGDKLNFLLRAMVPDLAEIGQIFGNLGHAILNFAAAMPGLAELLLRVADGISQVILWASKLPAPLITAFMVIEEFSRWGGGLVTLLAKLGLGVTALEGRFFSFQRVGGILKNVIGAIPILLSRVAGGFSGLMGKITMFGGATYRAEQGAARFSSSIAGWAKNLKGGEAALIALAAAGVGFLIYKLVTAKTAAQQLISSLEQGITKAPNTQAFDALASSMAKVHQGFVADTNAAHNFTQAAKGGGQAVRFAWVQMQAMQEQAGQLSGAQERLQQQFTATGSHATWLAAKYHTTLAGAMVLADQAGVKLANTVDSRAWDLAKIKIQSLAQGYRSMGQPMGVVGQDVTVLGIQAGLASARVGQLNQAWDQFMQNLVGGEAGLGSFENSLQNMGQGIATAQDNLGRLSGKMSLDSSQFADALKTHMGAGAQAWQNFAQVVGSTGPQLIDWLRTAGAEGAIGAGRFRQAILDMASQLVPFAAKSKAARTAVLDLVRQGDGSIRTWAQLQHAIKATGANGKDLGKIIDGVTIKMGDAAQVAQHLGAVLQNDLISTMGDAALRASGVGRATYNYTQDLYHNADAAKTAHDRNILIRDIMLITGKSFKDAAKFVDAYNASLGRIPTNITTRIHQVFTQSGTQVVGGLGGSTSGGGKGGGAQVHVHVHSATMATHQQIGQAVQRAVNQKTIRNGSTQLFITGRSH